VLYMVKTDYLTKLLWLSTWLTKYLIKIEGGRIIPAFNDREKAEYLKELNELGEEYWGGYFNTKWAGDYWRSWKSSIQYWWTKSRLKREKDAKTNVKDCKAWARISEIKSAKEQLGFVSSSKNRYLLNYSNTTYSCRNASK